MTGPVRDFVAALALVALCSACGSFSAAPSPASAPSVSPTTRDADGGRASPEASSPASGAEETSAAPADAGHPALPDGGDGAVDEGSTASVDDFVTGVVSFDPGECGGFGAASMPGVVEGPPVGGGSSHGSTDVVSLGSGGSIVVSFAPDAIVDGPGPDFIVFENPFWVGGNSADVYAEPGEVSVSDDGVTWHVFPCAPTPDPQSTYGTGVAPPYGQCAGWHVVYSNPTNGISPIDPSVAGGDAFDLADVGVTEARYVRIVDKTMETCPEGGSGPDDNGFDLDAVSIIHAARP